MNNQGRLLFFKWQQIFLQFLQVRKAWLETSLVAAAGAGGGSANCHHLWHQHGRGSPSWKLAPGDGNVVWIGNVQKLFQTCKEVFAECGPKLVPSVSYVEWLKSVLCVCRAMFISCMMITLIGIFFLRWFFVCMIISYWTFTCFCCHRLWPLCTCAGFVFNQHQALTSWNISWHAYETHCFNLRTLLGKITSLHLITCYVFFVGNQEAYQIRDIMPTCAVYIKLLFFIVGHAYVCIVLFFNQLIV